MTEPSKVAVSNGSDLHQQNTETLLKRLEQQKMEFQEAIASERSIKNQLYLDLIKTHKEVQTLQVENAELKEPFRQLQEVVQENEETLKLFKQKLKNNEIECSKLQAERGDSQEQLHELRKNYKRVEAIYLECREMLEEKSAQVCELEQLNYETQTLLSEKTLTEETLKKNVQELETKLKIEQINHHESESNFTTLLQQVKADEIKFHQQIELMQNLIGAKIRLIADLQKQNDADRENFELQLATKEKNHSESIKEFEEKILSVEQQLANETFIRAQEKHMLMQLAAAKLRLDADFTTLAKENEQLQGAMMELHSRNKELQNIVLKMQKDLNRRIVAQRDTIAQRDSLKVKLDILEENWVKYRADWKSKCKQFDGLLEDKQELVERVANLEKNLVKEKARSTNVCKQFANLTKNIDKFELLMDEEEKLNGIQNLVQLGEKQLQQLRDHVLEAKEDLLQLQNESFELAKKATSEDSSNVKEASAESEAEIIEEEGAEKGAFQECQPNFTSSFLEDANLAEDSPMIIMSEEETKEVFTQIVLQFTLDAKDINQRNENQKLHCEKLKEKCLNFIRECFEESNDSVLFKLDQVDGLILELIQSAKQCGALEVERKMIRCWNLVVNYVAYLQRLSHTRR